MITRNSLETIACDRQLTTFLATLTCIGLLSALISCGGGAGAASSSQLKVPGISSFSPASGPPGTNVTITGANLTGATKVTLNGTSTSFAVSGNRITLTVPNGASTGKFSVTTAGGTAPSPAPFSFNFAPAPTLFSFPPIHGHTRDSLILLRTKILLAS